MAKYQAGDQATFGGKVVTLEAADGGHGTLLARDVATGRLMGRVPGDWALTPAPAREAPLKTYEAKISEITVGGHKPEPWTNAIAGLDLAAPGARDRTATHTVKIQPGPGYDKAIADLRKAYYDPIAPIMALPEDLNWPPRWERARGFHPLSPSYETQPVRATFSTHWAEAPSAEQIAKDIQEIAATFKAELSADPIKVRSTHDHVMFDLEVKNSTPETLDKMTKAIQRRIEQRLDASLLGKLPGFGAPPFQFQCRSVALPSVAHAPVYGLLGAPAGPRRHNATCLRCNGPAWEGFFVKKCERPGGCLLDVRPESVKRETFKGEDVFYARGRGISVRHPVQERAAALWCEALIGQAFGHQGSPELRHARAV